MSHMSGYPSRMQQVRYTRQSPNPVPSHNMAQVHESGFEEGRQPRLAADSGTHDVGDGASDATCDAAPTSGCDAAERGPRKAGDGPGLTYLCIEVLDGGGGVGGGGCLGGSRGSVGGAGSDGVGGRGSDGGYHEPGGKGVWGDPQSLSVVATDAQHTAPWPNAVSSMPEVAVAPNWPPGSPVPPWQTFPPARDWPILDARMWPKYHYPPGRAEFAHAWCSQLSQAQIDPTSPNREIPQQYQGPNSNSCYSQPQSHQSMWNPEVYESLKFAHTRSANKTFSKDKMEGPVHDQKDSGIDSSEHTIHDMPNKSFEVVANTPTPQEDSIRTLRGSKTDKTVRHSSKGVKKHSTRCKASLSTPLLPPFGEPSDTRNTPSHAASSRHENSIHRVLSDESFVRGPATPYYARRINKVSWNDKRTMDPDNLDNLKPGKMIKPPKPIKPVKAFKITKSSKPVSADGIQDVTAGRANTPQNGKVTKAHRVIPNKLNHEQDIAPKATNPIRSSLRNMLPKRHLTSQKEISPTKGVTSVHIVQRPATECRGMRSEKYTRNNNSNSTTYNAVDKYENNNRQESITTIKQKSENGINLVGKRSYESFQYDEIMKPTENINPNSYSRHEDVFNVEEPVRGYNKSGHEHEPISPFKDSRLVSSDRIETTVTRQETENKSTVESSTRNYFTSNVPSWPNELYPSSNVWGPKRSATESTFPIPNLRSKCTLQQQSCRKDAAVSTGPRLCVISTQTDEDESEIGASESYGLHTRSRPSANLGNKRPERFPSDASGVAAPTDPRCPGFFNPYSQDQYLPYRATLPVGNLDIFNPLCFGGYLPDGTSRDHICNTCVGCPNSPQRTPFWTPASQFAGYGMPISMHMPMPVPMCMTMPVPMTCSCESCGTVDKSGEMRRHVDVVDVAVGDSCEDKSQLLPTEEIESKSGEKSSQSKHSDVQSSEDEDTVSPSARKRIELLLAGLTPNGKTLHPERLNILLQGISPEIIKKIIEETACEIDEDEGKGNEKSKMKQEDCNNKLRELINVLSMSVKDNLKDGEDAETGSNTKTCEKAISGETNLEKCSDDSKSTVDKRKVKIIAVKEEDDSKSTADKKKVKIIENKEEDDSKSSVDKRKVKIIDVKEEGSSVIQEKEGTDNKEKTPLKEEMAEESGEKLENIVPKNINEKVKDENDEVNELKDDTKEKTSKTQILISESVVREITESTKIVKIDGNNNKTDEKVEEDKEEKQNAHYSLFLPTAETSLHIKIRTSPLFRNQENHSTAPEDVSTPLPHGYTILTSTDTESSSTSLNPETSTSDVTTVEAVPTQESIISLDDDLSPLVHQKHKTSKEATDIQHSKHVESCSLKVKESVKPESAEEIKETTVSEKKGLETQNKLESAKQVEEKSENQPQYMERRYSICPCQGVALISSKSRPVVMDDRHTQVSRPTSPSRPVTVSPIRPLPRPAPPPRRQTTGLLPLTRTNARRRRITGESGTSSSGKVHSAPRSGSIRPPRARVPPLLQATLATGDNGGKCEGASKSYPWSRLSFVQRTELARALVDSATCTVKVGDATVLLARSGLSSLMTIAEGILNQTKQTTKACANGNRKSAKSPTRSPTRASRSTSPHVTNSEKKKLTASDSVREKFKTKFSRDETNIQRKNPNSLEHNEHISSFSPTSAGKESSNGSKTSVSRRNTKSSFMNSFPDPPRAFSKGFIGKTERYGVRYGVERSEENFSDRDCHRQVPKTGRYCSMRTTGPLKTPPSQPLILPPRGFRGHGRSSRVLNLTRKNESLLADSVRNSSNLKESSFKRRLSYSEKYENFRKQSGKIADCKQKKDKSFNTEIFTKSASEGKEMNVTKSEQKYESVKTTKNSLNIATQSSNDYTDKIKSKNRIADGVKLIRATLRKSSYSEIHDIPKDLENQITFFKCLAKKCKSLALVSTLLSEVSINHLQKSLWRSMSTPTVCVNNSINSTSVKNHRSGIINCLNHNDTRSGNNFYHPSEHTGSRLICRSPVKSENKNRDVSGPHDEPRMSTLLSGAHPDCGLSETAPSRRRACPSSSAPPGANLVSPSADNSRAKTSADDFYVLHPPRHALQAGRPSRPRLPVTAVAAAQRGASRSQSHASAAPQQVVESCSEEWKVVAARSAIQTPPVRTPPTPWRDE